MIVLLAFLSVFWIVGLVGQFYSAEATMRYLAFSLALVAVMVWRLPARAALRRRWRDRRRPPQ
jgi:hypothetical protein